MIMTSGAGSWAYKEIGRTVLDALKRSVPAGAEQVWLRGVNGDAQVM